MRKIVLVAAIAAGALSLAACSEGTEQATEEAADSAMADADLKTSQQHAKAQEPRDATEVVGPGESGPRGWQEAGGDDHGQGVRRGHVLLDARQLPDRHADADSGADRNLPAEPRRGP